MELPLFDRNQAGIARAEAGIERAAWAYVATRREVWQEVARSGATYEQAEGALRRWRRDVLPGLERSVAVAREAARQGSVSYLDALSAHDKAERLAEMT